MTSRDDLHYPKDPASPAVDAVGGAAQVAAARLAEDWRATSERAFASLVQQPELYQRTAVLSGALVEQLRQEGPGFESLLRCWDHREQLVSSALAARPDAALASGDRGPALATAFALRHAELVEEAAAGRRLEQLAAADHDQEWVVLEEVGEFRGDPFLPYRRVEAHRLTGRALLVTTHADDTFTACVHEVTSGRIDLGSGRLAWTDEPTGPAMSEAADREAAVAALRR